MDSNILNPEEMSYLIKKAELLKTSRQIAEIVKQMEEDLANPGKTNEPVSMVTYGISGKEMNIRISLDKLTLQRFDMVLPYFRKNLAGYHELREQQRELEEAIYKEETPDDFDVVEK